MPILNETDQVLLESCMDEIRNVVGDTISEKHLVETIMKHKFDCTKALDVILNDSTEASTTAAVKSSSAAAASITLPQSAQPMETGNHKYLAIFLLFIFHVKNLQSTWATFDPIDYLVNLRFIKFSFHF